MALSLGISRRARGRVFVVHASGNRLGLRGYSIRLNLANAGRGDRPKSEAGSPYPSVEMKFDLTWGVSLKKVASTAALSKPDIGPVSSPSARAAIIKYAPCSELLRKAETSRTGASEK